MIACILFLAGTRNGWTQEATRARPATEPAIIIVVVDRTPSEFKDAIVDGLVERYQGTCTLDVVQLNTRDQPPLDEYDIVVIVDRCLADMRLNRATRTMTDEAENVVLFVTAANPHYEYSIGGIDAVTSPSRTERVPDAIREITERIDELLQDPM